KPTRNAAPASLVFFATPAKLVSRRFQHRLQARILDVLQTKLHGIDIDKLGQLVNMNFTRKVIRSRGEPAIRALSQRRLAVVKLNVLVRKVILDLNTRAAGVVVMKLPRRDSAVVLHAAGHFDHACRTKVGPVEFFFARPDELDRLPTRTREPRRFDRAFARVFAAVTGTRIGHDHAYLLLRNMKRFGQFLSNAERPLRAGPNCQLAIGPFGDRGAWLEWRVRDVSNVVRLREFLVRGRHAVCDRSHRTRATSLGVLLQISEQLVVARLSGRLPVDRD